MVFQFIDSIPVLSVNRKQKIFNICPSISVHPEWIRLSRSTCDWKHLSNLKLLTTPNEDAISQTLLLNRASNALQTHISATLIAPLDSQAAREYNESLNNNIRFLFCGGGGDIFYSRDTKRDVREFFRKKISDKTLNQKSRTKKDRKSARLHPL